MRPKESAEAFPRVADARAPPHRPPMTAMGALSRNKCRPDPKPKTKSTCSRQFFYAPPAGRTFLLLLPRRRGNPAFRPGLGPIRGGGGIPGRATLSPGEEDVRAPAPQPGARARRPPARLSRLLLVACPGLAALCRGFPRSSPGGKSICLALRMTERRVSSPRAFPLALKGRLLLAFSDGDSPFFPSALRLSRRRTALPCSPPRRAPGVPATGRRSFCSWQRG